MKWASALSIRPSLEAAIQEVVMRSQALLDAPADLGLVFISTAFASEYPRLLPLLQDALPLPALIGCGGGGVIGCDGNGIAREVEGEIALSLTLAHLPHVKVETFHVLAEDLPDLDSAPDAWINLIGVPPQDNPQFVLLADPFTAKVNDLLQGLDYAYPSAVKIGGLASDRSALGTGLFCDRKLYREGTVGVALSGEIVLETIVAQGCRPIGPVFRITEGERNILLNLEEPTTQAVDPPLTLLRNLIASLSTKDQELAQHSLFIGIARDEFKTTLEPGDFLIRNLIGVDPRVGAVAIGDRVRPGQRVQFHLRDAKASAEDLELLLKRYHQQAQISASSPVGALMFSCLGRGEGLYNQPNFDSQLFGSYVNNIPLSGFFCNGEIGPVGGSTFLHGYTSVFGICRQP